MNHLLQVCNVGRIVGGTAACAWTISRALPEWRHSVAFLSGICPATRTAFTGVRLLRWNGVNPLQIRESNPDFVILHNTSRSRCRTLLPVPSLQYLHSHVDPAPAHRTVVCSRWLAGRMRLSRKHVLHQAVPRPLGAPLRFDPSHPSRDVRALRTRLIIGRVCTPSARKWPAALVPFYQRLASRFPDVDWEFVGCPQEMQAALSTACRRRAVFHPASWQARHLLWRWDALLYHHPTLTESFGRTVAEAMRAGCIPIVDARGGFREQITNAGHGFLCGSASEFYRAVSAMQDVIVRRRMSVRCREHADTRFSLSRFRERLLQILRNIPQPAPSRGAKAPGSPFQFAD